LVNVPLRVPEAGLLRMAIVTELVAVVTILPSASWSWTVNAGVMACPAVVLTGCEMNASLAPSGTFKSLLKFT
jgi:hypothetical protein